MYGATTAFPMTLDFDPGEYLMQLIQSVWFLDSEVYLHSPLTFHSLTTLSAPAEKIILES
jgi:hypothetical protein